MNEIEVRMIRHATGSHMLNPDLIAGRSLDAELTPSGVQEALQKGDDLRLAGIIPDIVASSPAVRCLQTTEHILSAMGISKEIMIADDLVETDQGAFVGKIRSEVYTEEVLKQISEQGKDFALSGCESMNQVGRRGLNWLKKQEQTATDKKLIIFAVAHAGLITQTVGAISNWDQLTSFKMLRSLTPTGESTLTFNGNRWQVKSIGDKPLSTD